MAAEIHKLQKNGVTIYPATTTDAVVDPVSKESATIKFIGLDALINGDEQKTKYTQNSNKLDYTLLLTPIYYLKAGETLHCHLKNIITDNIFTVYIRSQFENLSTGTVTVSDKNKTISYTADKDIAVDKIRLYSASNISLSCDIEILTDRDGNLKNRVLSLESNNLKIERDISDLNESIDILDTSINGDKQVAEYKQDSKPLDYTFSLTPAYNLKAGDTLYCNIGNIVASGVFAIYIRSGYTNLVIASTILTDENKTLSYTTEEDITVDKIRLYSASNISLSCNIEVFTGNAGIKDKVIKLENDVVELKNALNTDDTLKECSYLYDGNNLLIAVLNKDGTENTYWFKKCMANNLFTFYRVGYRTTDRLVASANDIMTDDKIVLYNETISDNVGPLSMTNGRWTGGNHLKDKQKTAITDYYEIYADGKKLSDGNSGYASSIIVLVTNILYNPAQQIEGDILTEKLSTEFVAYNIKNNTIEVCVTNKFEKTDNTLSYYYGMQSMFINEDAILFPNSEKIGWQIVNNQTIMSLKKQNNQKFNRFIEKSQTNKTYQSTYLLSNYGLGQHEFLLDTNQIFSRSYSKDYHTVVGAPIEISEKIISWRGCYTFFHTPICEDDKLFIYNGIINGKKAVYINSVGPYSGYIDLKEIYGIIPICILENNGFIGLDENSEITINGRYIYLSCENPASIIFCI